MKTKLLFICTANINRSRAAEELFVKSNKYEVQSAGFRYCRAQEGRVTGQLLTQTLIDWADMVFVMDETKDGHLTQLMASFDISRKGAIILDIPDIFDRSNPDLSAKLKSKLITLGINV